VDNKDIRDTTVVKAVVTILSVKFVKMWDRLAERRTSLSLHIRRTCVERPAATPGPEHISGNANTNE
jgi:hypothetical protein